MQRLGPSSTFHVVLVWLSALTVIFVVLATISLTGLLLLNKTVHDVARAQVLAANARQVTTDLEQLRRRSILENCRKTNYRHDKAIRTLDKLIAAAPPAAQRRSRANRKGTVLLIQALVPRQDCLEVVARQAPPRSDG